MGAPLGADAASTAARTYQNLSGSFRDYTFFAPAVASDLRAGFLLHMEGGRSSVVSLTPPTREVAFRYNSVVAAGMRDEAGRDLFAQSWAALILGSEPQAGSATVLVQAYEVPTLQAYRAGQRPSWKLVYAGSFQRETAR